MKQAHAKVPTYTEAPDLYQDETLAMVYIGDVYSLIAQIGTALNVEPSSDAGDDNDTLLPFIR